MKHKFDPLLDQRLSVLASRRRNGGEGQVHAEREHDDEKAPSNVHVHHATQLCGFGRMAEWRCGGLAVWRVSSSGDANEDCCNYFHSGGCG